MHKSLGAENMVELLSYWSSDACAALTKQNDSFTYKVVITLEPNPPECKGTDQTQIVIWKTPQPREDIFGKITYEKSFMAMMSDRHYNIEDCIKQLNEKFDDILDQNKAPDIIELGNKKYRLVEIK